MSLEIWTNPNDPKPKKTEYPVGTVDWEFKKNNIFEYALDMALKIERELFPGVGIPLSIIAGGVAGDGAYCPTYGLWAGSGWSGGQRLSSAENGKIEWSTPPCYNDSIKGIATNPNLDPESCISLVDAITKTHDWMYTQAENKYSKDPTKLMNLELAADVTMLQSVATTLQTGSYVSPTGIYNKTDGTWTEKTYTGTLDFTEKKYLTTLVSAFLLKVCVQDKLNEYAAQALAAYVAIIPYIPLNGIISQDPLNPLIKNILLENNGLIVIQHDKPSSSDAFIMNANSGPSAKPVNVNIAYGAGSTKATDTFVIKDGGVISINGGSGDDEIRITRATNDTSSTYTFEIAGGGGYDTYYLDGGFNYKLIDSGENTIYVKNETGGWIDIGNLYKKSADNSWRSEDGSITLLGKTITLQDGNTIELADNFQSGEFGINLINVPSAPSQGQPPQTNNTIVGDLQPIDFNPDPDKTEYHYDQWGNVICENIAEPGRADSLYDTPGNDLIQGGAGNDGISANRGGDNILLGGDGDDYITTSGTGNNTIEGNAGDDIIWVFSSAGDNVIDGGTGDDYISTMHNGNDWIKGGDGNDIITYNSQNGDMITTAQTNSIIEGGSGSDIILGHYTKTNQLFGDSYGDMATLIAAGEVAPNSSERGDFISDFYLYASGQQSSEGFIYGSNGSDILINNTGKGLIVGGGGDDLIYGDFDGIISPYQDTWGYSIQLDGENYTSVISGISITNNTALGAGDDDVIYAGTGNDFVNAGGGDDEVYGGTGNDTIFGGAGNDFIEGGDGDDYLVGDNGNLLAPELNGDDYIDGGAGNNTLYGGDGDDQLVAGTGDDYISGNAGNDYIDGGEGNNTLYGGEGDDELHGGTDNDYIDGYTGNDYIDGGDGNNTLIGGGGGDDTIFGGSGDDHIQGDVGNDYIAAGDGTNIIFGGDGNNEIYAGSGNDQIQTGTGANYIDAGDGTNAIYVGDGNNEIYAGTGDDYIHAGNGNNYIDAGDGANTIITGNGSNEIYTGIGNNQIQTGTGNDYIDVGDGNNIVVAGAGDDTIYAGTGNNQIWGGAGQDTIYGGAGNDVIYTDEGNEGDAADFADGGAGDDTLVGGSGNDSLYGGDGNDYLEGDNGLLGTGNDYLDGGAGADTILGEAGDDTLYGGTGNDYLQGDKGNDTYIFGRGDGADIINTYDTDYATTTDTVQFGAGITATDLILARSGNDLLININGTTDSLILGSWFSSAAYQVDRFTFADSTIMTAAQLVSTGITGYYGTAGNDVIYGTNLDDTIYGLAGNDALYGYDGNNLLDGGSGNDQLIGGADNDTVYGGDGNDFLYGYAGNDLMDGGADNDYLSGGDGDDTIYGGTGTDTMYGGTGNDTFYVDNSGDVVSENSGQGIDTVYSSVSYTLGNNVENLTLSGSDNISATGNGLDNVISGNSGSNILSGSAGNDTYLFGIGSNVDIINNSPSDYATTTDTVQFGAGITAADLVLVREVNDLRINIAGTNDTLVIQNWFAGDAYKVDQFIFADNTVLTAAQLEGSGYIVSNNIDGTPNDDMLRGTNSAEYLFGYGGNDSLYGDDNNSTFTGGNDTLDGGPGNDYMEGDAGDDTYIFGRGSGQDTIDNHAYDWNQFYPKDTIKFGEGIALSDLTVTKQGYDLLININGTADTLKLYSYFYSDWYKVGGYEFADGTSLDVEQFETAKLYCTYYGTAGGDSITGTYGNDTIYGYGGGDRLSGGNGGADVIYGGDGNDTIQGGGYLDGGAGDDSLTGLYNDDTLDGGTGNDYLAGQGGNDTYIFGRGSGQDTIYDHDDYNNATGGNADTILLGNDIQTTDVSVSRNGSDLVLSINGSTDSLTVKNWSYSGYEVEYIQFADGTIWDASYISQHALPVATEGDDTLSGTINADYIDGLGGNDNIDGDAGDDTLIGGAGNDIIGGDDGNDIIDGGTGNDSLYGGKGNDTYLFGMGSGQDVIGDYDDTPGNIDKIILGAGISPTDVKLSRAASYQPGLDDLVISISGTSDTLNVNCWFAPDGTWRIEEIQFVDGTIWDADYIMQHALLEATEGNDTLTGSSGNDSINGLGGNDYISGLAGDDTIDGGTGKDSMLGGTGNDIYIVDNTGDVVTENAGEGTDIINSSVTYTLGNNVENLTLTGTTAINGTGNTLDNYIIGNSANNSLTGAAGNDTLDGGAGADSLIGGAGNDTYIVDNTGDVITEGSSAGTDTVNSSVTYTLASNVENLTLTGTAAINATGNSLNNVLTGNSANNTLSGGTGADTMLGGAGNDTYVVDNTADVVTENANEGTDIIQSSVTYTIGNNVENLILTGTSAINGTGNTLDNYLTGNTAANTLTGNAGNDTLDGGTSADTMIGGTGNDTYIVDNTSDVVTENANEGTDTVQSSVTYTLGNNVENLALAGTSAINGTGNTLNNVITGNSAANTLSGGTGADTMIGGLGNDTYVVDNTGDVVTENANEGTDLIQSSVTYTLAANVESLALTGSTAINGTGNELDNTLTGNTATNTLTGGAGNDTLNGGTGADTMLGGLGNDTYVVDNTGDVVTENASEGTDLIQSSVTYTLGNNVENLTLTGTSAINGTGNTLDNYLIGNSAINTLTGGAGNDTLDGGTSADKLIGGKGNDTYIVDNTGDVVTENANEGTDTVNSSVTYTLATNVENLTLTGTSAINATGNALDNYLTGNSAANTLTGGAGNDTLDGGAGADKLIGGTGNDTYVVDNTSDVVTENASEGTDTVNSSITYTLGSNVENLTLTGTNAINGTGNALNNLITGNSAVNTLTGGAGNDTLDGGLGNDILTGGNGSDTYLFRRTDGQDTINETAGVAGDIDNLKLTNGITTTEPVLVKQNNDLYVFIDANNYVKIAAEFQATNYGVERLEVSDGHYITRADIQTIVDTMSSINNNSGMDIMQKYTAMMADQQYQNILAASWK